MTFFFLFVAIIALLFLILNFLLAPHNPYQEKYSIFECGFHSFLGQNRTQFGVKFFIFALVYLLLDLEILLTFPFAVSGYVNNIYGLIVALLFIGIITIGFVFELGKSALKIESRQVVTLLKVKSSNLTEVISSNNIPKAYTFTSSSLNSQATFFSLIFT
jgi:NADH-ubiquinone oxidoreductase chain 3